MTTDAADHAMLRRYAVLFWDFDGVIKDSVGVKGRAFERLFAPFGVDVAARVRRHHEQHGGVSRYEKLRLYLRWAGETASDPEVERYCDLFSSAVRQAVIDADWVPGAREYLEENHGRQTCILLSATPQREMEGIVSALGGAHWFHAIHGAPVVKADAIIRSLAELRRAPSDALLIGDSDSDHEAARRTGVAFLLRRTAFNEALQGRHAGPACAHFAPR
jgi:phosphoglycolate phosphatase-like HAD superfamily hydrolase